MNYRDLQNISNLSQEILVEGAKEEHNVLNRWPYTSPYLQDDIMEAEVLAQKGGVPGTVQINKTREGGFLGIGSKEVSKPVSGSFKAKDVSSKDSARYNTGIDKKFGSADNIDDTSAANVQYAANRAGNSGYMKVKDPGSLPNTGIPNRPTPGRASDQNQARQMSGDIVRMNRLGYRKEQVDLYDIILSHLLDEGYAETVENAESIMVNMSEDWRESIFEEYDIYEERKDPPVSRMSKQARHKAFRLGNEINDPESGIGLNVKDDPTAKQLRNMARVGGKQVKSHIKKGYEQGRLYDPQNAELNWKRNSKG
jgi:hypothetical protein